MSVINKTSIGKLWTNNISCELVDESKFELDLTRKVYIFDIVPMGAVRMSQSDKWKTNPNHSDTNKRQREVVTRYFAFKNTLRKQAQLLDYQQSDVLEIVFCVPMPSSWSNKKKQQFNKTPVKSRPDIDNYVKAFMDSLLIEDGNVWKVKAEKRYAFFGSIIVYK
jgi:Holliday junction resolvase RusA-like endonuclease